MLTDTTPTSPATTRRPALVAEAQAQAALETDSDERPTSPTSSRPRTPQPSSEVTPWEFYDAKVSGMRAQRLRPSAG